MDAEAFRDHSCPVSDKWHHPKEADVRLQRDIPGLKADSDKARWDLLPLESVSPVVDVLTYGAAKYAPDNWRHVSDWRPRYFAAAMRHLTAWFMGQKIDPESGHPHLAHAMCCLLFLMSLDAKN